MSSDSNNDAQPLTFPQVGLEQAAEAALDLYLSQPSERPLSEGRFRQLLGFTGMSGRLARLTAAMRMYGLLSRSRKTHALTAQAVRLFSTDDRSEFRSILYGAAMHPDIVQSLSYNHTARLDLAELAAELNTNGVPLRDRTIILGILEQNQDFLQREHQSGALFARTEAEQAQRTAPAMSDQLHDARRWLSSLPGHTANLTMVALLFASSLIYVAYGPTPRTAPMNAQQTGRSAASAASAAPAASLPPTDGQLSKSAPAAGPPVTTASAAASNPDSANLESPGPRALASNQVSREAPDGSAEAEGRAPTVQAGLLQGFGAQAGQSGAQTATTQTPVAPVAPVAAAVNLMDAGTTAAPGAAKGALREARGVLSPVLPAAPVPSTAPSTTQNRSAGEPTPLERGRALATRLFADQLTGVWSAFSLSVRQEWGSFAGFAEYREGGKVAFGAETRVLSEEVRRSGGVSYYTRTATFERGPDKPWTLIFGFDAAGQVVAFNIVAAEVLPTALARSERS